MARVVKAVLVLALLGFAGLTAYAYLGDFTPERRSVTKPVVLNGG